MKDLPAVFQDLRTVLASCAEHLDAKKDTDTEFHLDTRYLQANGTPLFFGAVQLRASRVSYHLMPVYLQPALLDPISPALRKRMPGKSCFNFTARDPALFRELAALTQAARDSYRQQGFI